MPQLPINSNRTDAQPPMVGGALPSIGFLRQPQLLRLIPVSKSTLWRRVPVTHLPAAGEAVAARHGLACRGVRQWMEEATASC